MTQRLGWILVELEVERILSEGYAELNAILNDDTAADAYLKRVFWNMSDERRAKVKAWLRQTDVKIVENYPKLEQALPCQAIVLGPGDNHEFVGLVGCTEEIDTVGPLGRPVSGEQWNKSVGVLTRSENPEQVMVLHQLAAFFVARQRQALVATFQMNVAMAERDVGFVREQLAAGRFVYERALQLNVAFLQLNAADVAMVSIENITVAAQASYAAQS